MIITISGQYGSGGNEVGARLAEALNYKLLDSQLVVRAREIYTEISGSTEKPIWWPSRYHTPFHEEDDFPRLDTPYEQAEFKLKTDLIATDTSFENLGPVADKVRQAMLEAQSKAILEFAEEGDCILFGKCSNFVLRDYPDSVHVFSTADLEIRIKRIRNLYNMSMKKMRGADGAPSAYTIRDARRFFINMSRKKATELILATDKRRASCYEFITGEKWGDLDRFDFLISGNDLNLDAQTDKLLETVKSK